MLKMILLKRVCLFCLTLNVLALLVSGCAPGSAPAASEAPAAESGQPASFESFESFELQSSAFAHESAIPAKYTCSGEDISPPLQWGDPPAGTQAFALIADDPDAPGGTWVHWVLYNLPAETRALAEATPDLADGGRHGQNSWGRNDYGGPCPPSGEHRYFFKLYALDTTLDLAAGARVERLLKAIEGHILAQAEVMGVYAK